MREHIGDGGMATVYKAWHVGLERYEALKIPRLQGSRGPEADFVQRLLAEARTAAGLHHPHIVAIHNVSEAESTLPYFSMDFVDGRDLQQLMKERRRLPIEEALPILRQVGAALDYAHSRGVIHRDIKPANILLHEDSGHAACNVKVVDFGISHAVEDPGGTRLTAGGMFVGTPEYMSPEQSGSGAEVDYRTDIYSLGIVAYEMLCGRPPFIAGEGVSRISIIMKQATQAPPPPNEHVGSLLPALNDAVMKALAKAPEERFQSCAEFLQALDIARETPGTATSAGAVAASAVAAPAPTPGTLSARLRPAATASLPARAEGEPGESPPAPPIDDAPKTAEVEQLRTLLQSRPESRSSRLFASLSGLLGAFLLVSWLVLTMWPSTPTTILAPTPTAPIPTATAVPGPLNTTVSTPRLEKKRLTRRDSIPYPRRTQNSASLLRGQKRLKQRGQNGIREVVLEITRRGSHEVSRRVVGSRIVKATVPEVQLIGTRAPAAQRPAAPVRTIRKSTSSTRARRAAESTRRSVTRPAQRATTRRRTQAQRPQVRRSQVRRQQVRRQQVRRPQVRRQQSRRPSYSGGGEAPLPP